MQNREKQIEEMIETLKKCSCVYTDCEQECSQCSNEELYDEALNHIARTFYEAGYRKQKHGTWYHGTENGAVYAKCSACGRKMNYSCYGYAYCSLCGARMDGAE